MQWLVQQLAVVEHSFMTSPFICMFGYSECIFTLMDIRN
jgi:hypothetical protein